MRLEYLRCNRQLPVVVPDLLCSGAVADVAVAEAPWPVTVGRSRFAGRPWRRYIRPGSGRRRPTDKQLELVHRLQLHDAGGHELLLCDLKRARERIRELHSDLLRLEERDALSLVQYPSDVGLTLTSDHAPYLWLGGSAAGAGQFVTSSELASFMGIDSRGGAFVAAKRLFRERRLCRYVCVESVHRSMALGAAKVGSALLGGVRLASVGSLYSGAFDVLGSVCCSYFGASLLFVAETDPTLT